MDGDEVVDMKDTGDWFIARDTGDSEREAVLAVSIMATGEGLRANTVGGGAW